MLKNIIFYAYKSNPYNCFYYSETVTTHTWRPALADLETAFAFALPVSLPALPPAYKQ